MKKAILFCILAIVLNASDDYIPLSKISDDKKLEYNFVTLDNTIIEAKDLDTKAITDDGYSSIPVVEEIKYKAPEIKKTKENKQIINNEIKQKVLIEKIEPETIKQNVILKDEINISNIKKEQILVNTKDDETQSNSKFKFSAQITYSPITTTISGSGISLSNKTNGFVPEIQLQKGNHKAVAEYFKVENDFLGANVETTIYKLGYRYVYENANVGVDANYAVFDDGTSDEEFYPSLEIDFSHNIDNIELSYGAGIGKNNNIDYAYDYFFNAGIKPYALSEASLVAGYKNRTIKDNDSKLEFKGPYIGVKSSF